jgi:serine/threonine-protein kinase
VSTSDDLPRPAPTEAVPSLIGVKLGGQYKVIGVVGEGGLGKIYRARQDHVDREVAVKFLPSSLAADQVIVKRLAREGKALARLSHPNIVTTYDFGFTEKREPYLVLELVQGESLKTHLDTHGPMPVDQCLPLFVQIADAMNYAHARGIVHRDIKPQNIMLASENGKISAKILDFGIAQMETEAQKLTLAGEIWGSPHYMSPEQCTAEPVDHLTDIYSLGVLMYCTLSNRLPHKGETFAEVVSQKMFEPIPTFAVLDLPDPIDVPLALERIIFRCLKRKKEERYQSMEELSRALETFARQRGLEIRDNRVGVRGPSDQAVPANKADNPSRDKLRRLILPVMAIITALMVVAVLLLVSQAVAPHRAPDGASNLQTH